MDTLYDKELNIYTGFSDGGCVDVGKIQLIGYTLVPDAKLASLRKSADRLALKSKKMDKIIPTIESIRERLLSSERPTIERYVIIQTVDAIRKAIIDL